MTWPQARGCWCLQTLEEGRKWISLEPPLGTSPSSACKTDSFWTSDFWNHRIIKVCCSGLLQIRREPMRPQLWHWVGCVTWCPPSRGGRPGPFPPPAGDLLCSHASRPCGDGLSVRSTCGFLPPGEGRPHARRGLLVGDSHLFRLWPPNIKKKKRRSRRGWGVGCQVLEMPGSGASLRAPGGARPQSPQTWLHPRDPGALGLGPACRVCEPLPGAGGCRLGVPACAHSSVTSGPRAWGRGFRLSDGIRIAAHFALGHLSDRRAEL